MARTGIDQLPVFASFRIMVAMGEPTHPSPAADSLELVEPAMAIEEALIGSSTTPGESGDYFDDDALASLVRNPQPRRPGDQTGAAAKPNEPSLSDTHIDV
jgi:hypothetical protein